MRPLLSASLALLAAAAPLRAQRTLERFDDAGAFSAAPSDGVSLALSADSGVTGRALRMTFDFHGRAGYAVARRPFALDALPPYWSITLWVRGAARPNTLELKLVDSTGLNVWWMRRPELAVSGEWTRLRFRPTDLSFAWGPLGGGPPRGIAALEIAVTAGQGGAGWIALDEMELASLPAPVAASLRPHVSASSSLRKQPAEAALPVDFAGAPVGTRLYGDRAGWHSEGDGRQTFALDFGGTRQLSGLVLDWSTADWAMDYEVEASDDGRRWTTLRTVRGSGGGRRFVHLPLTETTQLRLAMTRSSARHGYSLAAVHLMSDAAAATRSDFLQRVAQASAAGRWPRSLMGQQQYWTVVGPPRDERDALVSEDGAVESRPGGFSVEPYLSVDGQVLSWPDGVATQSLDAGWRPIPTVRRTTPRFELATTAFAEGPVLWVRYRVRNRSDARRRVSLVAAVRPVQVNPPWQFLGTPGGASRIDSLAAEPAALVVNGRDRVVGVTPPASVRAATFDAGGLATLLTTTTSAPAGGTLVDPTGFAEGALRWELALGAHDSAEVWVALPDGTAAVESAGGGAALARVRDAWDRELRDVRVELPADGAPMAATLRSALAHVLVNARGAAIQPGTRSYRRSWIRDGALTSSALMRLGHADDARAFLDWFLPNVFPNGKVPCCVDARGADPVTENDADGELLYLAAELFRVTRDSAAAAREWPALARVAAHLDSLRLSRRTEPYTRQDSLLVRGLLPPSISHEGYSAKPAYSYWDDWWGVRGLDDAALLAAAAGDSVAARRYASAGREMRGDVVASVAESMRRFGRQALPGAAELGDLDPTSSTIALEPAQALDDLPRAAVLATFDSAWSTLQRRTATDSAWEVFTPYEWRDVGAFVRLGQPERALDYARWLMSMRRPADWNQWSEAVWRDARAPKFIGDMPHGWVASDFIRATLDLLAYERERDSVLVVGAGVPIAWARDRAGVTVHGVRTWWGALDLTMRASAGVVRVRVEGVHPPGGIELRAPFGMVYRSVSVDGQPATLVDGGRAVLLRRPAIVEFRF